MTVVTKTCSVCRVAKPLEDFHKAKNTSHGRHWQCKPCRAEIRRPREREANVRLNVERRKRYAEDVEYREEIRKRNRLVRYRLAPEGFDALLASQGGRCASCGTDDNGGRDWHVDHDHACCSNKTGKTCGRCTRALLCGKCNVGLGHFDDDPEKLLAAVAYLMQFRDVLKAA